MRTQSRVSSLMLSLAMSVAVCSAQSVTSAHSGTLHYFEGDVSLDGAPVQSKVGRFSEIKEQGVLRTGQGRAEILLTPGVFLRVGENSAIRLLDNRLVSTRVELLSGIASVESDDPQMTIKDAPVTLIYKDYSIQMVKHGLLEINTDPAVMKVYKGEALVVTTGSTAALRATVKEGHQLPFSAVLLTEKFNEKDVDDLYLWARDRSQSLSTASMSSARSLNSSFGNSYGAGSGSGAWNGGWYYNQFFNMYTFVPGGGMFTNAFGYGFFSPYDIYNYYSPSTYWYGGGGARGAGAIGQTLSVPAFPTKTAAPLNTLRAGNSTGSGMPALGSPVRGGGVIGAAAGVSPASTDSGAMSAASAMNSGNLNSGSVGGSRGSMSTGGGASAGVSAVGGGRTGGMASAGGARGK